MFFSTSRHLRLSAICMILLPLIGFINATGAPPSAASSSNMDNIRSNVLHFSYELERWIDTEKRPCQDFFSYVCGKSVNNSQAQLEQRLLDEKQEFTKFHTSSNDDQLMDSELKVKQFYESCKNARSLEDLKSSFMYRLSGGWPAIDDALLMTRKRRNMTWLDVVSAFHDSGLHYFFEQHVEIKSNKRVVYLQPDNNVRYTLRKFEQLADQVMQDYEVDAGRARLIALEILNFERNRREIVKADATDEDIEFTYENFKSSLSGSAAAKINWDSYFKKLLGKPLKPTDKLYVNKLPKMKQIFDLLQNTTMTRLLNWIWIDYLMDKTSNDCQKLVQAYFEPVYQHIVQRSSVDRVQMAQMYAELGRAYEELLPASSWIDEMSQQNSKQFLGRIMHLTLNGDSKLDADYASLTITKRNFYRNLEKVQRFREQQMKMQGPSMRVLGNHNDATHAVADYMKLFLNIHALLQKQNLTMPLNYVLVAERFAEQMIASGSNSYTPGAWRSMDSERDYAQLKQCMLQQGDSVSGRLNTAKYNLNDLVLKMLAQHQAQYAFEQLQQKNTTFVRSVNGLLAAGRLELSLQKMYFIGSVLADCHQYEAAQQRQLVNGYLRNSAKFKQTFRCRVGDEMYVRNVCKVL